MFSQHNKQTHSDDDVESCDSFDKEDNEENDSVDHSNKRLKMLDENDDLEQDVLDKDLDSESVFEEWNEIQTIESKPDPPPLINRLLFLHSTPRCISLVVMLIN